jgi:hypothetical protein
MSAPSKPNKPKKLEKGKKGEAAKKSKKKSGSNLQIILAVVGVVVLLGVGITLFFLWSGDGNENKPMPAKAGNPGGAQPNNVPATDDNPAGTAPAPDLSSSLAKADELIEKLTDEKAKEEAGKSLRQLLDTDTVRKGTGRQQVLNKVKEKALAGNKGAEEFLRDLSRDNSDASLSMMARNIVDEAFPRSGGGAISAGEEPTNFLPSKTDVVFRSYLKRFIDSDYSRALFARGAFQKVDFDRRLGIDSSTVEQVVLGGAKDFGQIVGVIRTATPFNWDEVRTAMGIEGNGNTVKGRTYHLGKIDFLTEFLGARMPGLDSLRAKAAFWRADPNTLVYGDEVSIKDLLENPPVKRQATPEPTAPNQQGQGQGAPPAGAPPAGGGGGFGVAPPPKDSPTANDPSAPQGAGGRGAPPPPGSQPGNSGGGGGAAQDVPPENLDTGGKFLTLDSNIRRFINFTEDSKNESLLFFADAATTKVPVPVSYMHYLNRLPEARAKEVYMVALALPQPANDPTLRIGLACKSRGQAGLVNTEVEKLLTRLAHEDLKNLFGFEFRTNTEVTTADNQQGGGLTGPGSGGGFGVRGAGGGGGAMAVPPGFGSGGRDGSGGRPGAGAPPAPGSQGPGTPGGGVGGGGSLSKGGRGAGGAGLPQAGGGGGAGNQPSAEDEAAKGLINVERTNEYILITASVKNSLGEFADKHVAGWMTQIRGSQEMAGGKFRFGDVSSALRFYNEKFNEKQTVPAFPFGAYPRTPDAERGGRPYPPTERVSFLRELLPYLGDERYLTLDKAIDPEKSWRDNSGSLSNASIGKILIPHFLNPAAGSDTNYVNVRGLDFSMAATHFVGMAGVGPEAAYYPKSDPRAGIIGYNRQAQAEDVKDGLSNTIFMIEADKAALGPWIAGGGSTVRGTSDAGTDVGRKGGFSSPVFNGKQGVWALMADGSARFITKDINPEIFKALCTMAGSDSAGAIDLVAPKFTLEQTPRGAAATSAKKKRAEEEEATPSKK